MATRRGSALIIANAIIFVVAAIALFVLEKIIPVSQGTRGVENSNLAYYQAQAGVEAAMMEMSRDQPFAEPASTGSTGQARYDAQAYALTPVIPASGQGNSDYDHDWNKIGPNDPVQLALTGGTAWSFVKIYLRVPDLDGDPSTDESLSGAYYATDSGVVTWSLSSTNGKFLNPLDQSQVIRYADVKSSSTSPVEVAGFSVRDGRDQDATSMSPGQFAGAGGEGQCDGLAKCALRLSVIRPLLTGSGQTIPYLEYKIDFSQANGSGGPVAMPDRFTRILSRGVSFGFRRDIEKKIPQVTAVQGLDVTVFN